MLKIVHGIKVRDISHLLLMSEEAVQKTYERAVKKIKEQTHVGILENTVIDQSRLPSIINALYLIYTLGYDRPWQVDSGDDLCYDALRLTKCIVDNNPQRNSTLLAFYSLLIFHSARLPSRWSVDGTLCDLEGQDRFAWNQEMIQLGIRILNESATEKTISKYHLQATIASLHCQSGSFEKTPWNKIAKIYERMIELDSSPYVTLNLAIAKLHSEGTEIALSYLQSESFSSFVKNFQYHSVLSRVYESKGQKNEAINHLNEAIRFTHQKPIRDYLKARLASLSD